MTNRKPRLPLEAGGFPLGMALTDDAIDYLMLRELESIADNAEDKKVRKAAVRLLDYIAVPDAVMWYEVGQ